MRGLAPAIILLAGSVAAASLAIGPASVWHSGNDFVTELHKACDQAKPDPGGCVVQEVMKAGAHQPALEFAKLMHNQGWMRDFRFAGKVNIAYVQYPYHPHDQGWLFVNGSPDSIDPDDAKFLGRTEWKQDPSYASVASGLWQGKLFNGNRAGTDDPVAITLPGGAQQFLVNYRVLDACDTCTLLGYAFYRFDFDAQGKFQDAHYVKFEQPALDEGTSLTPSPKASDARVPLRPIVAAMGSTFSFSLPVDKGSGFDWQLASTPEQLIEVTGPVYTPPPSNAPGVEGTDTWTVHAVSIGSAEMTLDYSHPGPKQERLFTRQVVYDILVN